MVHHVELGWDILVEIRLWQIVRHVVEEVDVLERPPRKVFGLRMHCLHHLGPALVLSRDDHFVHVK